MSQPPFDARPPRPVADVPPAALADGAVAAKGWLLALLADRPLAAAPALALDEVAREGPGLCAAALRAVGSEAAVAELEPLGAGARALAGAADPASVVVAIGHLRGALWAALLTAMGSLDARATAALAERLAWVCDAIAAAALRAGIDTPLRVYDARSGAGEPLRVVDPRGRAGEPVRGVAWRAALARHAAAGHPCALLAVEVDGAQRLLAAGAGEALARAERAVRDTLRPGDVAVGDGGGRLWVVAAEPGADALARALAHAVPDAAAAHGAPLTVSIGVVACPSDGTDADALAALAEERRFAAQAAGEPLV